ncbi:MAG: PAS domain S-box protein [Verrucomicrobia bacterium]|nr:PAS domain S-box protein [Verrucomicrobiota bacterium]
MNIATKLRLVVLLPLLMMLTVGGMLLHFNRVVHSHAQRESVATDVAHGTYELNVLTYEHLHRRNARTQEQWRRKHATLNNLLSGVRFPGDSDSRMLERARWTVAELDKLFAELTRSDPAVPKDLETHLVGRLLTESQSLMSLATSLSHAAETMRIQTRRRSYVLTILFIAATAAGMGVALLLLSYHVARPIRSLQRGAEELAAGRLEHKIDNTTNDEIGTLARAFDSMAESLQQRIAERDQALAALRLDEERLEALVTLNQMGEDVTVKQLADFALETVVTLTGSKIGYLAFMNEDETVLTMYSWSSQAMAECAITDKPRVYPIETTGLWGEAVRQRKPVITNDYAAPNPLKKGYPEGHVPVLRHVNAPIFDGERIVIVAGVGNKDEPYNEADVRQLTLMMQGMWRLVQRREAEDDLRRHRDHLEELVADRTAELKHAEESARQERDRAQTYLDVAGVMLVVINADQTVRLINKMGCQILGYSEAEILGQNWFERFLPPSNRDEVLATFCKLMTGAMEAVEFHENTILTKTGQERLIAWHNILLYNERGEIQGVLSSGEDITEKRRAENRLKETAAALARSNAELEQFAYVASHDLREPLRMITSFIQLLERQYQDKFDADGLRYIGFTVDGARRMEQLITDLLQYARVGTRGKEFVSVDCNRVVQMVLQNLDIAIRESQAAVSIAGTLPSVKGDDVQLSQLFQNLIANGIKFRRPEEPPHIEIAARRDGPDWVFSVRDNGIGIDPKHFSRIFVLFQQLHTRDKYPGTGIGLAVCKKIVERHRGRIWVESEPDKGAAFFFSIPAGKITGVTPVLE